MHLSCGKAEKTVRLQDSVSEALDPLDILMIPLTSFVVASTYSQDKEWICLSLCLAICL